MGVALSWWALLAALAAGVGVYHGLRAWGGGPRARGAAALTRLTGSRAGPLARLAGPDRGSVPATGVPGEGVASRPAGGAAAPGPRGNRARLSGGGTWAEAAAERAWGWLPLDIRGRLARDCDLVHGGQGPGPRDILARGIRGAALGLALAVLGLASAWLAGSKARLPALLGVPILPCAGLMWPLWGLARAGAARRSGVLSAFPEALDLLVIGTAAGLNLAQALTEVARRATGALGRELGRLQSELAAGRRLSEALGALAARLELRPVTLLAGALVQAESLGTPLAEVMKAQAAAAKTWRRQAVEARVGTLPTRLTLVSVFLLMPAVFAVAVLPNLLAFMQGRW